MAQCLRWRRTWYSERKIYWSVCWRWWEAVIRRVSSWLMGKGNRARPWPFYTFGGSAPGAPIFDLSEICGGVFCGFSGGHCTRGVYMGRGNCQDWWHLRIWRVFGALTEDSQHFSWEGMMRCMTVGLLPSGIFILRFYPLATHFLIHYCLVTRT